MCKHSWLRKRKIRQAMKVSSYRNSIITRSAFNGALALLASMTCGIIDARAADSDARTGSDAAIPAALKVSLSDYQEMTIFAAEVQRRVRPNLRRMDLPDVGQTVVEVRCRPDGHILSARIIHPSRDMAWDQVALAAVLQASPMPLIPRTGNAPDHFTITLVPGR